MRKIRFRDRVRYSFDNSMARGPIAVIGWLALASALLVIVTSLIVRLATGGELGLRDILWNILFQALTPNPVAPDAGPAVFLGAMLFITLGSLFMVSILIGLLTASVEGRVQSLRKGRSFVIEQNHTLILNWSPKVFTVISELVEANANQAAPRIVILAEEDKVEMEDQIRDKCGDTGHTKIICRTGNPLELVDLEIVNPHAARSVIILAPTDSEDPDSEVIKTILALTNNPNRRADRYHIVAEIADAKNLDVARMVGKHEIELIVTSDLISRIIVQTSRQSGLSIAYTELLDFAGDEIYFQEEPALIGRTFGEALLAFEDSAVIGLRPRDGGPLFNPPMDTKIQAGDKIIAVSEDDDTVKISNLIGSWDNLDRRLSIDRGAIHTAPRSEPKPERTLILGWNARGPAIVQGLDSYVAARSEIKIVADLSITADHIEEMQAGLHHQRLTFQADDTTSRAVLNQLAVPSFDQVIVLAYSDALDQQEADARTLITLLHLRDIAEKGMLHFRVVSEMLDVRNRELAEVTKADDFIVSNKLTSLMLSQVSENKELNAIFEDMFDPEGSEVYLKPASDYVELSQPVNFYTVVEAARSRGHAAFGYRLAALAEDHDQAYGVVVNPDKSKQVTFAENDRIIVAAED